MICLAEYRGVEPMSVTEIARKARVPRAFLEQILSDLKRRNLLLSRRGKQGGFWLAREPAKITFADIIRHIDGPLALAPCASRTAYRPCPECEDVETCTLRPTLDRGARRHGRDPGAHDFGPGGGAGAFGRRQLSGNIPFKYQ